MALSIVYPPKGSTDNVSTLDIVAVHGLGGDAIDTWTHPTSNAFWLRDFLPQHIPDARILSFGYNAAAAFGNSTSEVIDHAKSLLSSLVDKREGTEEKRRPLIFIAHSLGGIVVKQALLQARLEPRYHSICDVTLGILFFGTPHRGSDKASYGKVLANIVRSMTHRPPARLLTALQTNSDILLRLTADFRFQLPQYHVVSFFEQRSMSIFSRPIVERYSALLEVSHEEQIPVDANHSMMCKFKTDDSDTFEKVYKRIRRMRDDPQSIIRDAEGTVEPLNKFFEVPHLFSAVFTGQNDACQRMDSALVLDHTQNSRQPFMQRRFVLFGLGGSGKTQVCVRYTHVHRHRYWGVFWIDASTSDNIRRSIMQIALLLQVEQNVDSVKRALANMSRLWLLVFDNADDPSLSLTPYFPSGDRGHIIINSRNPVSQQYASVGHYELAQMLPDDAELLLLKIVYGHTEVDVETKRNCRKVIETLGHLALAIAQAGAYLQQKSCTFATYLELYQRQQIEVLAYFPQHSTTDYQHSVYTTWQVSIDTITSIHDSTSISALRMLRLLGYYHHDQIPISMFYNAWRNSNHGEISDEWAPWSPTVSDLFELQESIRASISLLTSFSLLRQDSKEFLSIHPLVHDWCRLRLSKAEREHAGRQATTLLVQSITLEEKIDDFAFRRSLFSHVQSSLQFYEAKDFDLDDTIIEKWTSMALVLQENGSTRNILQLAEHVVQSNKNNLGEEHLDTIDSMHSLAVCYNEAERRNEAIHLIENVIQLRKSKLGEEHPNTLESMHNLAKCCSDVGRHEEAVNSGEQVTQSWKSLLGESHLKTLESMHNLAKYYSNVGRHEEAVHSGEQVTQSWKSLLGESHPKTLTSMYNLARYYSNVGRQEEALQLAEQVVRSRKSLLGEDHPHTLSSMHNLAVYYSNVGRQEEALHLEEQVVQSRKSQLGESHPDTLSSKHNLAKYYSDVGRQEEALQLAEHVVQSRKSQLGEDHPDTYMSEKLLVYLLEKRNEGDKSSTKEQTAAQPKTKGLWRRLKS